MPARRRPNAADHQASDAVAHSFTLLRVAAGQRAEVLAVLRDLEIELVADVQRFEGIDNVRSKQLRDLLKSTQANIAGAYSLVAKGQESALERVAVAEVKATNGMLNRAIGVDLVSGHLDAGILNQITKGPVIMGHSSASWWTGQGADLQRRFAGAMQAGILRGESVDDLLKRVRGTKANAYKDGVMNLSRRDAEALVLTSVQTVSNSARLASYEAQPDLIKAVQWLATLDSRTTLICRALDKKQWSIPGYEPIGHDKAFPGPIAHWRCRSTPIAVTRSWAELSGKKIPALDNRTLQEAVDEKLAADGKTPAQIEAAKVHARASMDGQVADTLDMNGWMNNKGEDFQTATLGPGRASLFRAGQITMSDLTDQSNRPLTLGELEAIAGTTTPPPETLGRRAPATPRQLIDLQATIDAATARANQEAERARTAAEAARQAQAEAEVIARAATARAVAAEAIPPRAPFPIDQGVTFTKLEAKTALEELMPHLQPGDIHKLGNGRAGTDPVKISGSMKKGDLHVSLETTIGTTGQADRSIYREKGTGKLVIKNEYFRLPLAEQGNGRGFNAFYDQAKTAQRLGVDKLSTYAAQGPTYNGYYTWPRFGYDGPLKADTIKAAKKATGIDAKTVLDLYATPAGREWWKKNGYSLSLEFDLSPGSRSHAVLDAYAKTKGR